MEMVVQGGVCSYYHMLCHLYHLEATMVISQVNSPYIISNHKELKICYETLENSVTQKHKFSRVHNNTCILGSFLKSLQE